MSRLANDGGQMSRWANDGGQKSGRQRVGGQMYFYVIYDNMQTRAGLTRMYLHVSKAMLAR